MPGPTPPLRALLLPGGGARCAYQVGVLRAIASFCPPGPTPFPIICGTSAGAINAAVLASHAGDFGSGVERLAYFWGRLGCDAIYRTDPWSVLSSALRWGLALASGGFLRVAPAALLDNSPLRALLQERVNFPGIDQAIAEGCLRGVAVTASGYTRAAAVSFYQAQPDVPEWQRPRRWGVAEKLGVEHLLASVALPLLFPAERLGNEYFGDGGMRTTAPLSPAIHLGADRILVIALRDENPDPPPSSPQSYPAAGEIAGYLLDTIFMDSLNGDLARLERINHTLSLVPPPALAATGLRHVDSLVIRPRRDLRQVTAEHARSIPPAVRLLLRTLGGWGHDWRMASYLLFEPPFCMELMQLGYADGLAMETEIRSFLSDG